MSTDTRFAAWLNGASALLLCFLLAACAAPERSTMGKGTWAGRTIGAPPARRPGLRQAIIARATREWEYFRRQTVVMKGQKESIPNVGAWEDDDAKYSARVNSYWRAVGQPGIDGMDCQEPWSAAFMSWVMSNAGVPESQFPRTIAHWVYMASMIEDAHYPGRYFVPRRISDYSPEPGDLICASRNRSRPLPSTSDVSAAALQGEPTHCDLVVRKSGRTLEAIGGNVRNSVSKVTLELDRNGRLQAVPRRPWFMILQNRL
jgi:hypothetical protein